MLSFDSAPLMKWYVLELYGFVTYLGRRKLRNPARTTPSAELCS